MALRKNPACHPVIRASLVLRERPGEENRVRALQLLEIAWQARRCQAHTSRAWVDLIERVDRPRGRRPTRRPAPEDVARILAVLDAQLGKGPMPRKPRRKVTPVKKRGKSARAPKVSARVKATKKTTQKKSTKKKSTKKKSTKKKATKKKATKKKATKKTAKKKASKRKK